MIPWRASGALCFAFMPVRSSTRAATLRILGSLLGLGGLSLPVVLAAPPEPVQAEPAQPSPEVYLPPGPDRFWLSAELIGPRGAQLDAASSLATPPVQDELPRGGAPPPGEYVGSVTSLDEALRWVDLHALTPQDDPEAPELAAGALFSRHGVVTTALVVTPRSSGTDPYPWPSAAVLSVPSDLGWRPASLSSMRAPLFAAPAAQLPPASERYRVVEEQDALWLLDQRDVCSARCMSWSSVLVRRGDRFFAGWLPSTQVIPDDAWVGGPQERRFALRPGHRDPSAGETSFALLEQGPERREGPVGIEIPHAGKDWPPAGVEVIGEELVVLVGKRTVLNRHIETLPPPFASLLP